METLLSKMPILCKKTTNLILFFQAGHPKKWTLGGKALLQTNLLILRFGTRRELLKE